MKRSFVFSIVAFIAIAILAAYVSAHREADEKDKFTKHFTGSIFRITENGEFSIELIPDEKEYKIGKDVIGIVVHDKHDGDVENADIEISYEGMSESPIIKEKGEGLYIIKKLDLKREGHWSFQMTIKKR